MKNPTNDDVVKNLKKNGIAVTNYKELGFNENEFTELVNIFNKKAQKKRNDNRVIAKKGFKDYQVQLFNNKYNEKDGPFIDFMTNKIFIDIVNKYFGMMVKLFYLDAWLTNESKKQKNSQFWHRDPEDNLIIKIFIYINDVNNDNGPFIYAPRTHGYGNIKRVPKTFMENNNTAKRSKDEDFKEVLEQNKWKITTGKKGTIIFADTAGWHKGGFVKKGERKIMQAVFTSPAYKRKRLFSLHDDYKVNKFNKFCLH
tara:strand:- start:2056 stop:2820 length:765 start_codon:yes stop_codon:yes gene_type:complete